MFTTRSRIVKILLAQSHCSFVCQSLAKQPIVCGISLSMNKNGLTHVQTFNDKKPQIENLKVFECTIFVQIRESSRPDFDNKASKCKFLGCDEHSPGFVVEHIYNTTKYY